MNPNIQLSAIIAFIADKAGIETHEINEDTDVFWELGLWCVDCNSFLEEYAEKFKVNMDNYLWYFHADEEGINLGALLLKPPNKIVKRIPITPKMLQEFADKGEWQIDYHPHKLPNYRYDLIFNPSCFILSIILFVVGFIGLIWFIDTFIF